MKRISSLMIFFIPLILFSQSDTSSKGIQWATGLSWEQVKAKAKAENKYIFVDCYATWCVPCKLMDRDVYSYWRVVYEMNDKFVPIKVQMDTTSLDDEQVKTWRADAQKIMNIYRIEGYPTFLFISPDGKLLHKEVGYKNVESFRRMVKLALDPQKNLYYSQFEDYKKGKRNYSTMVALAIFTKKIIGDQKLAYIIAKDCKENYLDKLNKDSLITKENLDFIGTFYELMNSKDNYFDRCYYDQKHVDKIRNWDGWSKQIVELTISKEEIEEKVIINGRAEKLPNWKKVEVAIAEKYNQIDAKRLILKYKLNYYLNKYKDWKLWANCKNEMIRIYPPSKDPMTVYTDINGWGGAWLVFMKCDERRVIKNALRWANLAISIDSTYNAAYLDTKANILYKLGKRKKAIALEQKALALTPKDEAMSEALKKMKLNLPTWPIAN